MFSLFQAGYGRYSNNYEMYRQSFVPEKQPGGGGWSIFQLGLGSLYTENQILLNWWTQSNKHLNLCRYLGCKIKCYRQPNVDYVVNYNNKYPFEVTKYHYASSHPERLLTYNKKIVVPSFATAPLLRKRYYTKYIKPPSEFTNKWFFQAELCRFGLVMITSAACSLTNYFISPAAESNNITLNTLNTKIFTHKNFKVQTTSPYGYYPSGSYYLFGTTTFEPSSANPYPKQKELIYLGNSTINQEGDESAGKGITGTSEYKYKNWGNPWYFHYLNDNYIVWMTNQQPNNVIKSGSGEGDKPAQNITRMTSPIIQKCRYNPFADKGDGNEAYWLSIATLENSWDTDPGPENKIIGFPLWILLWGWEDWTRKLNKLHHLDNDYVLVVKTRYIKPEMPAYVFLSDNFINGIDPNGNDVKSMPLEFYNNWYPCWQYQKQAIENILMAGPAVCKNDQQIQAHLNYTFYFKWGGNPTSMESVYDPCSQPSYPLPNTFQQTPEIENPEYDPTKQIYNFDIRRHFITQTAAKRITENSKTELSLFTDGTIPPESRLSVPIQQQKSKKKTQVQTSPTEKTGQTLQQQLQFYRTRRQQLRHRFQQLTKQLLNSKSHTANSE